MFGFRFGFPLAQVRSGPAGGIVWLIDDQFTDTRAAGEVDGTAAAPGPGTRDAVDTEDHLAVGSGLLDIDPRASTTQGDPGLWYEEAVTRATGIVLLMQLNRASNEIRFGFDTDRTGTLQEAGIFYPSSGNIRTLANGLGPIVAALSDSTDYIFAIVLSASGSAVLVKGGAFSTFSILFIERVSNTATLYAGYSNLSAAATSSYIRCGNIGFFPVPLASDGFGSAFGTTDGLGHAEGVAGGVGAGGSGDTWADEGGWATSAGTASNTPAVGADAITNGDMETGDPPSSWSAGGGATLAADGDAHGGSQSIRVTRSGASFIWAAQTPFTVGQFYKLSGWFKNVDATNGFIQVNGSTNFGTSAVTDWTEFTGTFRASTNAINLALTSGTNGQYGLFDDVVVAHLGYADLIAVVDVAENDVYVSVEVTCPARLQAGIALNVDDAANPQNATIVYLDRLLNTIVSVKIVGGVVSQVGSSAFTYSAGAALVVRKSGTGIRIYYNNAFIRADTISDAGIVSNTKHGLFSADPTITLDDFALWAADGYAELDAYVP